MEIIFACLFVLVWALLIFCEREKDGPRSQDKSVVSPATAYQTVKRGKSSLEAESINPAHTVKKPDPKYDSVLSACIQPDIKFQRFNFPALPTILENEEGEDLVAEIESLTAELAKTKSDLQQQQQSACLPLDNTDPQEEAKPDILCDNMTEVTQERDELQMQVSTLNEVLSEQNLKIQHLEEELEDLSQQLAKDRAAANSAVEHLTTCYENRIAELLNELAVAKNTAKPITKDVGCGTDVEVAVACTQTECIAKDVGCGTEQVIPRPAQSRSTGQEVVEDQSCGFTLDFQIMEQCKNPRRSFFIPARERTKPPAPAVPKAQVDHFPVGDIRYKNKPMSGYVVNSDGTQETYGEAVKSTRKPTPAILTKNKEAAGPSVSEQPKDKQCTTDGPVKSGELTVVTLPVERVSLPGNRLVLKNIPGGDYGRIIGSGGSNIRRIETEYQIVARLNTSPDRNFSFLITGNTEAVRQAAADDIVRGLTVTTEFSNSKLPKRIKNVRLNDIGRKYFVRINRPSDANGTITMTGRLSSCQSAYAELIGGVIQ